MSELTPYDILGIEPTSDKYAISGAYKRMILLVHPDKAKSNGLGWTKDQCQEAFGKIRKAYKTIVRDLNFTDMPDYNLDYDNNAVDRLDVGDFKKCKNVAEFNKLYTAQRTAEMRDGYVDAYSIGYDKFNRPADDNKTKILLTKEYSPSASEHKAKKTRNKMVKHTQMKSLASSDSEYELGLTTVDDFSFKGGGSKNGLMGSDLSQVHEEFENWDVSVSRNPELYKKYNTTRDLDKEIEDRILERSVLDNNIDVEYKKAVDLAKRETEKERALLAQRRIVQSKNDRIASKKYIIA